MNSPALVSLVPEHQKTRHTCPKIVHEDLVTMRCLEA